MLINESPKFAFIHIQKTAGLSIERFLLDQSPRARQLHGRHGRVADALGTMGADEWAGYFSFAFVRNPWDRMVSWYSMIEAAKQQLTSEELARERPFQSDLWNYAIANSNDFDSFLRNCTATIFDLGCNKNFAFNQVDYLTDSQGKVLVDFVGRFENLAEDMGHILSVLQLEGTLPRLNASTHAHYTEWYSDETRQLVADRYLRDIEAFGYSF